MARAFFLDRDGVINIDVGHAHLQNQIQFTKGIFKLCRKMHELGYLLIVITNQSGIGRGMYTERDFHTLMKWMLGVFEKERCPLTAYYFCPHLPEDRCRCRKPKIGMLKKAKKDWQIDMRCSVMMGDKETDMEAARAAGIGVKWLSRRAEQ